jgi:hypothetical protein
MDIRKSLITISKRNKIVYKHSGQELLRATHLAINPEFVWLLLTEGYPGFVE